MALQIPLRCACGKVRGAALDASARTGTRVVCYCDDCQAFGHFLGRDDILNDAGGTDIFQMAPANVRITEGLDLLRCMRLSDRGLLRWYTDCCKTPVGNTVGARMPFVGVLQPFMDHASDGRSRDEAVGKPLVAIFGKYAVGGCPDGVEPKAPVGMVPHFAKRIFRWWVTGKGSPSPFFDATTKAPRAVPRVLSDSERQALKAPLSVRSRDLR